MNHFVKLTAALLFCLPLATLRASERNDNRPEGWQYMKKTSTESPISLSSIQTMISEQPESAKLFEAFLAGIITLKGFQYLTWKDTQAKTGCESTVYKKSEKKRERTRKVLATAAILTFGGLAAWKSGLLSSIADMLSEAKNSMSSNSRTNKFKEAEGF